MERQEINALTGLRGIAATAVMFYHFNANHLFTGVTANFLGHGYLMVDLFLILSGFILALTYGQRFEQSISWKGYGNFLVRRIARMYPMYALMSITAAILVATGWMDHWPGPRIPISAFIDLTMFQSILHVPSLDAPGWSVSAEWIINLFFPLLALLCLRRSLKWTLLITVLAFAILPVITALPVLAHEPKRAGIMDIWNYTSVYPVLRCFADFVMGIMMFRLWKFDGVKKMIARHWLAPSLLTIIILLLMIKDADLWIVALFPLFILSLVSNTNKVSKWIGSKPIYKLGIYSYSIYLIHNQMNYFMLDLAKQLEVWGMNHLLANGLSMLIFASIVIVLANLAYHYIEMPARNWIKGFTSQKPKVVTQKFAM